MRVPGTGCGAGGCRMVSGTGSSLIPGPGEKADPEGGYVFNGVAGRGEGDKGGSVPLAVPSKPSKGDLMVAGGGDKLPGALVSGLLGSASPARPPA